MLVVPETPRLETRNTFDFILVARSLHAYTYLYIKNHISRINFTYRYKRHQWQLMELPESVPGLQ